MHYIDDPFIAYITRCQIESFQAGHFFNHGCLFLVKENLNDHEVDTLKVFKHNNINSRENLYPLTNPIFEHPISVIGRYLSDNISMSFIVLPRILNK